MEYPQDITSKMRDGQTDKMQETARGSVKYQMVKTVLNASRMIGALAAGAFLIGLSVPAHGQTQMPDEQQRRAKKSNQQPAVRTLAPTDFRAQQQGNPPVNATPAPGTGPGMTPAPAPGTAPGTPPGTAPGVAPAGPPPAPPGGAPVNKGTVPGTPGASGAPGAPGGPGGPGSPGKPIKPVVGAPSVPLVPEAVGGAVPSKNGGNVNDMPEVLYEGMAEDKETSGTRKGSKKSVPSPKVTVIVKQMDIDQVFERIRQQVGIVVRSEGAAKAQKIDAIARGVPLEDLLTSIANGHQWVWVKNADGTYAIMDQQYYLTVYVAKQVLRRPFPLKYIDAEELDKIIQPILTPQIGSSSPDSRTNKLIVTDLPDKIALIESIIAEYDVQLYTRVFEIQNAKTEEIAEQLNEIKSKAAEIQTDPVNRTIIVKDTFEKIKMMEQLVGILDRDQEIRIYNINNIGVDGEVADDLIKTFIEPIATEDAVVEFNKATGKLFVKDVRSVQDKILDILKQIDRPRKQVLVEGEILDVALTKDLQLSSDWDFSSDLNKGIRALQPIFRRSASAGTPTDPDPDTGTGGNDDNGSGGGTTSTGLPITDQGLLGVSGGSTGLQIADFGSRFRYQLNAFLNDSRTRLLLRPRLLIANHEQGSFNVTSNDPVLQTFYNGYNNNNNNGYSSSGQTTVETGIIVEITPHISNRGLVELETHFENSVPITNIDLGNGQKGVATHVESAETFLIIPSGETRVIGGLITDNTTDGRSGIPYLSQIPYVGWLFGSRTDNKDKRDLMFFITPTIIEEQPQNDIVVEPVNKVAQRTMLLEAKVAEEETTDTTDVNPIPESLRPYLEDIRPEPVPMPANGVEPAGGQRGAEDDSGIQGKLKSEGTDLPSEPSFESDADAGFEKPMTREVPGETVAPATKESSEGATQQTVRPPSGQPSKQVNEAEEMETPAKPTATPAPMEEEESATGRGKRVILKESVTTTSTTESEKTINALPPGASDGDKTVSATGLLRDEPYVAPRQGAPELKVGGAVASLNMGGSGPKGALGGGQQKTSKAAPGRPGAPPRGVPGTTAPGTGAPGTGAPVGTGVTAKPSPTPAAKQADRGARYNRRADEKRRATESQPYVRPAY